MTGYLKARGIHVQQLRIRESMKRSDPEGVLLRTLQLTPCMRRVYNVKSPLSLWHVDGHHKLIRYSGVARISGQGGRKNIRGGQLKQDEN